MQQAELQHATCKKNVATLQTRCKLEDATCKTDKMQQAKLQHATCKKQVATLQNGTSACNMQHAKRTTEDAADRMQQAQQTALQRAAYTTQHRRHATAIQHTKQTTCNSNVKHATDGIATCTK
jgi:hypothetical protein